MNDIRLAPLIVNMTSLFISKVCHRTQYMENLLRLAKLNGLSRWPHDKYQTDMRPPVIILHVTQLSFGDRFHFLKFMFYSWQIYWRRFSTSDGYSLAVTAILLEQFSQQAITVCDYDGHHFVFGPLTR